MNVRKSTVAIKELGITYARLVSLLRARKVAPPQKDTSGDYLWTDADLESVRQAMTIDRRRKEARTPTNTRQVTSDVVFAQADHTHGATAK
jgi:hypothetical protein